MRTLLLVRLPNEPFNTLIRAGSASSTMNAIMEELKPEAAYFAEMQGRRTALLIVEVAEASDIPRIAEPWFLKYNAEVEFHPVMTPEDLKRAGMDDLGKKWK